MSRATRVFADDRAQGNARAAALKEAIPDDAKEASFVAKRIYHLRNALVHYRPFHRKISTKAVDWNRLCEAMTLGAPLERSPIHAYRDHPVLIAFRECRRLDSGDTDAAR